MPVLCLILLLGDGSEHSFMPAMHRECSLSYAKIMQASGK